MRGLLSLFLSSCIGQCASTGLAVRPTDTKLLKRLAGACCTVRTAQAIPATASEQGPQLNGITSSDCVCRHSFVTSKSNDEKQKPTAGELADSRAHFVEAVQVWALGRAGGQVHTDSQLCGEPPEHFSLRVFLGCHFFPMTLGLLCWESELQGNC